VGSQARLVRKVFPKNGKTLGKKRQLFTHSGKHLSHGIEITIEFLPVFFGVALATRILNDLQTGPDVCEELCRFYQQTNFK
jgi:hypothetical protein